MCLRADAMRVADADHLLLPVMPRFAIGSKCAPHPRACRLTTVANDREGSTGAAKIARSCIFLKVLA